MTTCFRSARQRGERVLKKTMKGMLTGLIKRYHKLLISLAIIVAMGFGLTAGLSSSYVSLERSLTDYVKGYGYPDGVISTRMTLDYLAERLKRIDGVADCEARYYLDTVMKKQDGNYLSARIYSFDDEDRQEFKYWEKKESGEKNGVLLEYNFAKYHDIKVGDTVMFNIFGEYYSCCVEGIVSRPETLSTKKTDRDWGINYDFGFAYMSAQTVSEAYEAQYGDVRWLMNTRAKREINELLDTKEKDAALEELKTGTVFTHFCNQFLLYYEEGYDAGAVHRAVEEVIEERMSIRGSYTYDDSPVKLRIDKNLYPIYSLIVYCPTVFFAITLGIVFLFMSMIIRQSRREIGILRALGFQSECVRWLFCKLSIAVTVTGLVIGCGIGYGIMRYVGVYFENFFPLPSFTYHIDVLSTIKWASLSFAVCVGATLLTATLLTRVSPVEAMARRVSRPVRIPGWLDAITHRLPPMIKFSLISNLRAGVRSAVAIVFISASTMLIFASFSFIAAKNHTITETFDERIHYDFQVFTDAEADSGLSDRLNELGYVNDAQELLYYDVKLKSENGERRVNVNAVSPDTKLIGIYSVSGEEIVPGDGEIIIDRYAAADLGVDAGDTVYFGSVALKVAGLSAQSANRIQYISLATARDIAAQDERAKHDLCCIIGKLGEGHEKELVEYLLENEKAQLKFILFIPSFYRYNLDLFGTYDVAAYILTGFAVIIGFVILFNTAMTSLQENTHSLSILRAIGFQRSEISVSRYMHTFWQFAVSSVIGLWLGYLFASNVLARLGTIDETFVFSSGIREYAVTVLLVFFYLLISHQLAMRSMKKWNIADNVRERE